MIGFIIWIVGLVCAIWCVLDIFKKKSLSTLQKVLLSILVLIFSWVGLIVYYIFRNKIA
ncbi:MAG: PLDc N-terminal domain-containing protein [Bacteroidales bacterium]|nr:PLDc N-terminal domain-containing protein [Bacteroidales bacterium]